MDTLMDTDEGGPEESYARAADGHRNQNEQR